MDFHVKVLLMVCLYTSGQSAVESAPRLPRLSVAEDAPFKYNFKNIEGIPGAYSFNYDISDEATGNIQYRTEDRYPNGTVTGAYGYIDAFGAPQRFRYIADQAGYRVYREDRFKPFYGYHTTLKPIDKLAVAPTEPSVTWTRPKRPNKNQHKNADKFNNQNPKYNLIGPPSLYVPYY